MCRVEGIVQGFTNVQYRAIKMAMTNNKGMLVSIIEKLDEMNAIELQIKKELERQFLSWKGMKTNQSVATFNKLTEFKIGEFNAMKYSLCTISFRHQLISFTDIVQFAYENGFEGIELWGLMHKICIYKNAKRQNEN